MELLIFFQQIVDALLKKRLDILLTLELFLQL